MKVESAAVAEVLQPEQSGFEEVAPENVRIAVTVEIGHREGIGSVEAGPLADDLDVLETVGDQAEPRRSSRIAGLQLVAGDGAVHPAQHEVHAAVAVDVGELGDVLPVGVDRDPVHVLERIGRHDEVGPTPRAGVVEVADVTVLRFGEEVRQAVPVHVGETVPLSDVDVLVSVGLPLPAERISGPDSGKEGEFSGVLLEEQVGHAVATDIDQLRARVIVPAEKRAAGRSGPARRIPERERSRERSAAAHCGPVASRR